MSIESVRKYLDVGAIVPVDTETTTLLVEALREAIEYSLPVMNIIDWEDFSEWLDELETETLLSFNELVAQFEQTVGKKIQWLKEKNA